MDQQELFIASRDGQIGKVKELLVKDPAVVNTKDDLNRTALHRAAGNGRDEVVELLLGNNVEVNAKAYSGRTALHEAAENGHNNVGLLLLENNADVNAKDDTGQTALHRAAENGHNKVLQSLLEKKADVNAKDDTEQTALHLAARKGREAVVQSLLKNKADVNAKDDTGQTALHRAAENGHNKVVQSLLEKKADVNAKDDTKQMALHLAAKNGHEEVLKLLLEYGANFKVDGLSVKETLRWWRQMGKDAAVQPLLENGANIDVMDIDVGTALRWVAANGYEEGMNLLLGKGVNVDACSNYGRTALHWAAEKGCKKMVELLLDEQADVNAKDNNGETALRWAAKGGHRDVIGVLFQKGADVNATDNYGRTTLHVVAETDVATSVEVLKLLLDNGADINAKVAPPKMAPPPKTARSGIIPNQYIVTLQPYVSEAQVEEHINAIGSHSRHASSAAKSTPSPGASEGLRHRFEVPGFCGYSGTFDETTLNEIKNSWEVEKIEPNTYVYKYAEQQDVPSWGLARICRNGPVKKNNPENMTYAYSPLNGNGTFVYVIDSGVDGNHQEFNNSCDLQGTNLPTNPINNSRVLQGINVTTDPINYNTNDSDGHGTHVAGTIAGITCGVAKQARIIPVKVFFDGLEETSSDILMKGLEESVKDAERWGIDRCVANISLGTGKNDPLNLMVAYAVKSGLTVVVAAGNEAVDASEVSPASAPEAIVVGATTIEDSMAWYSNHGEIVDFLAPGSDIISARAGARGDQDLFIQMSGTSMACPHVTGVVCCLISTLKHSSLAEAIQKMRKMIGRNQIIHIAGSQTGVPNLMVSAL